MKKRKILFILFAVILIGFAVLGRITRRSYTDISSEADYMDRLMVAVIPEESCALACDRMRASLPEAPMIVRLTPEGDLESFFGGSRQKAVIKELFSDDGPAVGQEIYVTSSLWRIITFSYPQNAQRGYVNILRPGEDYLVFLSGEVSWFPEEFLVYQLYDNDMIAPVFCCQETRNSPLLPTGDTLYVPYPSVKENEFFSSTEAALQAWLSLKEDMLSLYLHG